MPVNSVNELIALGKSKPGTLNYGTFGVGSTGHLNMELLESMTGAKFTPVHYKGAAPAMLDVIAGNIPMMLISVGNAVEQAKAGRVKFIADGAPTRMKLLPDIPAIAETVPGYTAASWFGLYGPAGMPADVVAKLNEEVRKTFTDPEVVQNVLNPQYFEFDRRHAGRADGAHQRRGAAFPQGDRRRAYQGRMNVIGPGSANPHNHESANMRTITVEEHFATPGFLDGPGKDLKESFLRFGARGQKLVAQIENIGAARSPRWMPPASTCRCCR